MIGMQRIPGGKGRGLIGCAAEQPRQYGMDKLGKIRSQKKLYTVIVGQICALAGLVTVFDLSIDCCIFTAIVCFYRFGDFFTALAGSR